MARSPPRRRNLAPLPSDIYLEISHHTDRPTLAAFNRASVATHAATHATLYRHIEVLKTAPLLVRTLGNDSTLSAMVHSLRFTPTMRACEYIEGPEWNQALIAMTNLKHLTVQQYVNMQLEVIGHIHFQLNSFTAGGALSKAWFTFFRAQRGVKSLTIFGWPILLVGPVPTTFTHLEHLSASPYQIAVFLAIYPLKSVRFIIPSVSPIPIPSRTLARLAPLAPTIVKLHMLCDQFRVANEAGPWLLALEELTLDEGNDHWNYRLAEVQFVALELRINNVPRLSSLRLVSRDSIYSGRRFLVAAAIRERCDLTTLLSFTLCSTQGCTKWCAWGTAGETSRIMSDCELPID
ncbi:hypothetical protein C8J57DRAFT_1514875 [Mycena rebaudengoi]|nr:hypothetical protein C8J57DRAFT_1514875 [Mycena rebaudengoi]